MAAQLGDSIIASRMGIIGRITVGEIVNLASGGSPTWFDYVIGNTSANDTETPETIDLSGNKNGISSEIIYKGVTYKRFDLNDDSQSYILTTLNAIVTTQK